MSNSKKIVWYNLAFMAFSTVWGFGNVVNEMCIRDSTTSAQFDISDNRTLDEVVKWLCELNYIPSFCTACYREGRTGDRFMQLCKSGQISNCCHPNALMTLKEYSQDYAGDDTKLKADNLIMKELDNITSDKVRKICQERLTMIEDGKRDFRF